MNNQRKTAIATLLFGGMASLTFVYDTYGWFGVIMILGVVVM